MSEKPRWYVAHTYSGYENKVKANIEKTLENRGMNDQIIDVVVPMQDYIEEKDGVKKTVSRKVFPGYVLIHMYMNDDTWYIVRNTRGVTSFVGPGSKPVALTDAEIASMGINVAREDITIFEGDTATVITGPFENSIGIVKEVNQNKHSVILMLSVFGRDAPVELSFDEIKKL